jgi:predicted DsbA family dithiol-disulfide isomerase
MNMKVDVWSDVRCPFCYIGKRKFEMALDEFPHKEQVEVVWHSFELDPSIKTDTTVDANTYLAKIKGQTPEWAKQMNDHVTKIANEVGIDFNLGKSVIANSFNAHRLIQLANSKGLGAAAEETLFKAHFTDNRNIDDEQTLIALGGEIGLNKQEVTDMLATDAFTQQVREDEAVAQNIGINGVPFFVLNNKYGVSGAQAPETFLGALNKAWEAFSQEHPQIIMDNNTAGDVCDIDGNCTTDN